MLHVSNWSVLLQSVTELHDGSALFVTVAKYLSPALHDIDQVGITPDVQCTTDMLNSPKDSLLKDKSSISSLEADSCIMVAEHELDIQQSIGTASWVLKVGFCCHIAFYHWKWMYRFFGRIYILHGHNVGCACACLL